jgi:hypothetical protein
MLNRLTYIGAGFLFLSCLNPKVCTDSAKCLGNGKADFCNIPDGGTEGICTLGPDAGPTGGGNEIDSGLGGGSQTGGGTNAGGASTLGGGSAGGIALLTYQWRQVTHAPPSGREFNSMAFDEERNQVVMFGGQAAGSTRPNETWLWNGTTWRRVTTSIAPVGRAAHAMAYDRSLKKVVLFGGDVPDTSDTHFLWAFEGDKWSVVGFTFPPPRRQHGMAFSADRNSLVVFGGLSLVGQQTLGDTWEFKDGGWFQYDGGAPPARKSQMMGSELPLDGGTGRVVLFGGIGLDGGFLNDTWAFDSSGWHVLTTTGSPSKRGSGQIAYDVDQNRMVLFGGSNGVSNFQDTYGLSGTNWVQLALGLPLVPSSRRDFGMAYDSVSHQMLLFGGQNGNDTWGFSGNTWKPLVPQARGLASMVYDQTRKRTVLFGGGIGPDRFDDTWEFDGIKWISVNVNQPPSGRLQHSMTYDSKNGATVLFGGGPTVENDLWAFDGGSWTKINVSGGLPDKRQAHAFIYDALNNHFVLYGGSVAGGSIPLSDTWFLSNTNNMSWQELNATDGGPGPRQNHAMAYELLGDGGGRVVLFGGNPKNANAMQSDFKNDTWVFEAGSWRELTNSVPRFVDGGTTLTPRIAAQMAFDSKRKRMILFGSGSVGNDAYELVGDKWRTLPVQTLPPGRPNHAMVYDAERDQLVMGGGLPDWDTWVLKLDGGF